MEESQGKKMRPDNLQSEEKEEEEKFRQKFEDLENQVTEEKLEIHEDALAETIRQSLTISLEEMLGHLRNAEHHRLQENMKTAHETIGKGLLKICEKDEEITNLETIICDKDKEINNLQTISKEKDLLLENCEKELQEMKRRFESEVSEGREKQKEMKACYAELDKKDKCLESIGQTLKETELEKSDIKKKYDNLIVEKKYEIQSKENEIESLKIEWKAASVLVKELKTNLNLCAQEKLKIVTETKSLRATDKKQKAEIANLKQIVTKNEKFVENLAAMIREHTAS